METKKELGQHFLINEEVAERIVEAIENKNLIVEIGPGRGSLTKKLLDVASFVVGIEIDYDLIWYLKNRFRGSSLLLIRGDGREIKLKQEVSIAGNLPYNMAKNIIKNFIFQYRFVKEMVLMVQKEVADKIIAHTGFREFGKFSILCQLYYTPKKLFNVKPASFLPPPKVNSAVVKLTRKTDIPNINDTFFDFLDKLFAHPRKTVKNNLSIDSNDEIFKKRPFQLSIEEIINLWRERWQTQ
ncbi:16S rRNA (adenine(1518)-N(6)/adenine(1519)-N(6))-dimethyltransferase RsmA [Hippea jasoniae]|uniref:16S rRNA (adenine(1518)-N(6)/adenine(1519)-N(6))- dimethyltransferase RsmA n=1 Tax=Hippea jasoniae TaxID=944479 RepID=UPI00054ED428|nr:16S rRNA (adenine(1518)-N(6)/adenine(1519)-N(6))-dimethyltransferase RsmA [Hippea jasoniae]